MNGPDSKADEPGEFETIARLLRPLTRGAPSALDLLDDAAVLPGRPGFDLVISQDAMTAGVHFLADMPMDRVARRLLRTALSDLAAKAAQPFGYLLTLAWPAESSWAEREAFAEGLALDGAEFGVALLGGDTVSTPGPFMASVTVLGWAPAGAMVKRSGARDGDLAMVSGTIGDGHLGLLAAKRRIAADPYLLERFELPMPRFDLAPAIQGFANASADVSDGLAADAGHLATASGLRLTLDLNDLPLSQSAGRWLAAQPDRGAALLALATGGDDYEIVAAVAPDRLEAFQAAAAAPITVVGRFSTGAGVTVRLDGAPLAVDALGWLHGG